MSTGEGRKPWAEWELVWLELVPCCRVGVCGMWGKREMEAEWLSRRGWEGLPSGLLSKMFPVSSELSVFCCIPWELSGFVDESSAYCSLYMSCLGENIDSINPIN